MNFRGFNQALTSRSATDAGSYFFSLGGQGSVSYYREKEVRPPSFLEKRVKTIEGLQVPATIEEFFLRVDESLADLRAIVASFSGIFSSEDRMWLDNIDEANRLLRIEVRGGGGGTGGFGGSGSGSSDDDDDGDPKDKKSFPISASAAVNENEITRTATRTPQRERKWYERMAESLKLLANKLSEVARSIGNKLWNATKVAVKELANGAMGQSAETASAWSKFWNITGRVAVGVIIGLLGGGGGGPVTA